MTLAATGDTTFQGSTLQSLQRTSSTTTDQRHASGKERVDPVAHFSPFDFGGSEYIARARLATVTPPARHMGNTYGQRHNEPMLRWCEGARAIEEGAPNKPYAPCSIVLLLKPLAV